jgi:putative ABC transport system ATP-binding protein
MLLRTEHLYLAYDEGKSGFLAVKDVSISFKKSGFYGILGPSGSGKTSLLYLLSGIKSPTSGKIIYNEEEFPKSVSQRNQIRREDMGFVFQFHFLINYLNVRQNILIGAKHIDYEVKTRVDELCKILGLEHLQKRYPFQLSGGQRQRVAIARAFANNPKVVFVDEPTASLDRENGEKVVALLRRFSRHACVIVVTHDETILNGADQIYHMWDGAVKLEN